MKPDTALPVRETLLEAASAAELLNTVLAELGAGCASVRPSQVRYIPESSITVRYEVKLTWPNGAISDETLVAMAGRKRPDSVPLVEVEGQRVAVWRYPNDPFLPGLAVLSSPQSVSQVFEQLGSIAQDVTIRRRVYRPGRRAVFELVGSDTRVFIKVVRPSRARALHEKHTTIAGAMPVPHSLGWSERLGLVALQAITGETLRTAIEHGKKYQPSGPDLVAMLRALPDLSTDTKGVGGPVSRARDHAQLLSHVLPDVAERMEVLVEGLGSASKPTSTVHGDFHTTQVLVNDRGLAGLIDVDSAGTGELADDVATMLAQISTLALGRHGPRFAAYGRYLLDDFDRMFEPDDLRRRVAASCLGFATGAFRVQQPEWQAETERRVKLAEDWLATS